LDLTLSGRSAELTLGQTTRTFVDTKSQLFPWHVSVEGERSPANRTTELAHGLYDLSFTIARHWQFPKSSWSESIRNEPT